jgi:hypothetical protein
MQRHILVMHHQLGDIVVENAYNEEIKETQAS